MSPFLRTAIAVSLFINTDTQQSIVIDKLVGSINKLLIN